MGNEKSKYWVSIEKIHDTFEFYGNYYTVEKQPYRNVICYVPKRFSKHDSFKFDSIKYDALFIMMNPGGSKPYNNEFPKRNPLEGLAKMVKAKPDQTQYQVARIAIANKWKSVCIVNLSDLINAKSSEFNTYLSETDSEEVNSLFNPNRKEELNFILNQLKNKKIAYVAWGCKQSRGFKNLATLAFNTLSDRKIKLMGVPWKENVVSNLYRHPLPKTNENQQNWLDNFMQVLK